GSPHRGERSLRPFLAGARGLALVGRLSLSFPGPCTLASRRLSVLAPLRLALVPALAFAAPRALPRAAPAALGSANLHGGPRGEPRLPVHDDALAPGEALGHDRL